MRYSNERDTTVAARARVERQRISSAELAPLKRHRSRCGAPAVNRHRAADVGDHRDVTKDVVRMDRIRRIAIGSTTESTPSMTMFGLGDANGQQVWQVSA